jgi:putative transposase
MMQPQRRKQVRHFDEPGHVHELTFSCYRQRPLLTNDLWRRLFCEAVDRAMERHRYRLFAFVIMPEHVHLIVHPRGDGSPIAALLKAIKQPFSSRIKRLLEERPDPLLEQLMVRQRPGVMTFRFWQEGPGYDRNLIEAKAILAAIDYVHRNPVRRGLCERAIDWKWSSARYHLFPDEPQSPDLPKLSPLPPDLLD